MLRTTAIAKELAVIERKLQETTNKTLKDALKKKQARLKDELKDFKKSTPSLAKKLLAQRAQIKQLSKLDFNDLVRRLSKKPEYSFLRTMSKSTIRTDIERPAKPVGWRFKGRGNYDKPTMAEIKKGKRNGTVYREVRPLRSDVSQPLRLETGGGIYDIKPTEELIELVSKERNKYIREWRLKGEKVVVARNDGYWWSLPNESEVMTELATNPSKRKIQQIIKEYPNVTEIHFNGTIKVSERVGWEMEIVDDFDVLLWKKDGNLNSSKRELFEELEKLQAEVNSPELKIREGVTNRTSLNAQRQRSKKLARISEILLELRKDNNKMATGGKITAAEKKELQPYKVLEYRKKAWKYTKEKYNYEKEVLDRLIGNDYAFKVLSMYKEKGGSNLTANIYMGTIEITCVGCSDSFLDTQFDVIEKYGYAPKDKFVRISISTARWQVDNSDPKTRYNIDDFIKLASYKKETMEHGGKIKEGDTWEWHTTEYDSARGNNYKFVKKVTIVEIDNKGQVIAQEVGSSKKFIIRQPEKYLKKKI
jgi:hypothetical protein